MLKVSLYESPTDEKPLEVEADYVSLVNKDTYGPPPLVAPNRGEPPLARPGDVVLYINTNLVPVFEIERTD